MDDEKLKFLIGKNIASYRKAAGLTQAGLGEKLSYSDKAVSKWERGESIPDVLTLVQLAEQFGVTVNDLLEDPNALPENGGGTLEPFCWLSFLYAIPANAIVLLSLRSAWHDFRWNQILISVIAWGFLLAIYATVLAAFHFNFWKLFLLGVPGQIAIFLWFRMFRGGKEEEAHE